MLVKEVTTVREQVEIKGRTGRHLPLSVLATLGYTDAQLDVIKKTCPCEWDEQLGDYVYLLNVKEIKNHTIWKNVRAELLSLKSSTLKGKLSHYCSPLKSKKRKRASSSANDSQSWSGSKSSKSSKSSAADPKEKQAAAKRKAAAAKKMAAQKKKEEAAEAAKKKKEEAATAKAAAAAQRKEAAAQKKAAQQVSAQEQQRLKKEQREEELRVKKDASLPPSNVYRPIYVYVFLRAHCECS